MPARSTLSTILTRAGGLSVISRAEMSILAMPANERPNRWRESVESAKEVVLGLLHAGEEGGRAWEGEWSEFVRWWGGLLGPSMSIGLGAGERSYFTTVDTTGDTQSTSSSSVAGPITPRETPTSPPPALNQQQQQSSHGPPWSTNLSPISYQQPHSLQSPHQPYRLQQPSLHHRSSSQNPKTLILQHPQQQQYYHHQHNHYQQHSTQTYRHPHSPHEMQSIPASPTPITNAAREVNSAAPVAPSAPTAPSTRRRPWPSPEIQKSTSPVQSTTALLDSMYQSRRQQGEGGVIGLGSQRAVLGVLPI